MVKEPPDVFKHPTKMKTVGTEKKRPEDFSGRWTHSLIHTLYFLKEGDLNNLLNHLLFPRLAEDHDVVENVEHELAAGLNLVGQHLL